MGGGDNAPPAPSSPLSLPPHPLLPPSHRLSFAGVCFAALATGEGPIRLLLRHISDPMHNTVLQTLGVA